MNKLHRTERTMSVRTSRSSGFTLLEMIVAIGVFLVALTIILGALVSINNAARKARSERIVTDNLSAAIDSISRSVRVGSNFHCGCTPPYDSPLDCSMNGEGAGGGTCLAFKDQQGKQIVYQLSGRSIKRSKDGGNFISLTAPEISIDSFKFFVYGTAFGDDQPVVTMVIRGSASTTARTATKFDLQTTVSAYTPNL